MALLLRKETNQVYVEVGPWTFESRPVETGYEQEQEVVVQTGLAVGERVVVKGGVLLND